MNKKVEFSRIVTNSEIDRYRPEIIRIYQEAFAGPPYFESFSGAEVSEILNQLVSGQNTICCVATIDDNPIGFSGGFGVQEDEDVLGILKNKLSESERIRTFYLAELAVASVYRNRGCGTVLVRSLLEVAREEIGCEAVVTRTQAEGSNAKGIFERTGFQLMDDLIQNVKSWIKPNGQRELVTQERIFLLKKLL